MEEFDYEELIDLYGEMSQGEFEAIFEDMMSQEALWESYPDVIDHYH